MQDLCTTPLCQIKGDIINKHKKFFRTNFCLRCRQVPGICECTFPRFSNPVLSKRQEVEDMKGDLDE
jgi:hypothetical protein